MEPTARHAHAPSHAAIAAAQHMIRLLSPMDPDLAALGGDLEEVPVRSFAPDPIAAAWRGLYLSIYEVPTRIVLVGSIDEAPELAGLVQATPGLLIVETDAAIVSTAEVLPYGTQWRSISEFATGLSLEDRVNIASALVNGLRPVGLLVWASRAGWRMLAQHGVAMRQYTALFATTAGTEEHSSAHLLRDYFRVCLPVLSALYADDRERLLGIAGLFALSPGETGKLRALGDWHAAGGFLSAPASP